VATLVLSLIFAVLLLPVCLGPAVRLLAWPIRRALNIEGEMSERLVLRHATRSALTIGVLFISVSTSLGIGNSVFTVNDDVHKWINRTITADFLLRVMMPNASDQAAASMPESVGDEIAAIDGVERVDSVKTLPISVNGQKAKLLTRDFSQFDRVPLYVLGDDHGVLERLLAGEVALGSVLAERVGVHEGDTVEITAGDKKHSFRVAALVTEYAVGGLIVTIDSKVADQLFHIHGVAAFFIKAKPGRADEVEPSLSELAVKDGLLLQSFAQIVNIVDKTVAGTTIGLWVLLALGLVVGALGVINTLTMNVLEQTREIGMLRAIGMRRRQIVKTVLGQAGIIGWLGVLTGAVSGIGLSHTFNRCLGSLFGRYMQFSFRPGFVGALVGAALAVVLVSALVPARRAAALNPLQSMRQD
jgi:putative ABC transport system permease protein